MAAIMSLDEPRPRGTVLGERADRRRVREAEHFFRCKACNGWIDARDLVWFEDHQGPLPHRMDLLCPAGNSTPSDIDPIWTSLVSDARQASTA
jgi:hypothetical protein